MKTLFKISALLMFACLLLPARVQGEVYYMEDEMTPDKQLHKAIITYNVEMARDALANGANSYGKIESLLSVFSSHSVMSMGLYSEKPPPDVYAAVSIIKKLIDAGADVNEVTVSDGMPVLIRALDAASANIDHCDRNRGLVKVLLDAGVDVDVRYNMEKAIHGDGSKARIRPYCPDTISALCMAAFYMDAAIVEQILKAGNADIDDIEAAIGIAQNRILKQNQQSVISVLERYRDKLSQQQNDESETEDAEQEQKAHTTVTITKTEEPEMNKYVLYGAIGCGALLLITIIVLGRNGGGGRSVIMSTGLSRNKIAGPKVSSMSRQRSPHHRAAAPAPRIPHRVHTAPAYSAPRVAAPPQKLYQVYMADGTTAGPYTVAELRTYLQTGALSIESLVWTEGMSDWTPLGNILGY